MKFLLVMAALWAGNALATTSPFLTLKSLRFTATESLTLVVDAMLRDEEGQSTKLQVKGVVSRPEQIMEVSSAQSFPDTEAIVSYVQDNYCKREYVPAGVSEFNAGRNINTQLKDYVPARLRIEITYHLIPNTPGESPRPGDSRLRKTSFLCPNSMRE